MATVEDVTVTVSGPLANELIERAGTAPGEGGGRSPTATRDPGAALRQAFVVIAEDDLAETLHDSINRLL